MIHTNFKQPNRFSSALKTTIFFFKRCKKSKKILFPLTKVWKVVNIPRSPYYDFEVTSYYLSDSEYLIAKIKGEFT